MNKEPSALDIIKHHHYPGRLALIDGGIAYIKKLQRPKPQGGSRLLLIPSDWLEAVECSDFVIITIDVESKSLIVRPITKEEASELVKPRQSSDWKW